MPVELEDDEYCEGCPALIDGVCNATGESLDQVEDDKQKTYTLRPQDSMCLLNSEEE